VGEQAAVSRAIVSVVKPISGLDPSGYAAGLPVPGATDENNTVDQGASTGYLDIEWGRKMIRFVQSSLYSLADPIEHVNFCWTTWRTSLLELSYNSAKIRTAALDRKVAEKVLGEDLARSFHSLVADIRDAANLGELPDVPIVNDNAGCHRLDYSLGDSALLMVEPIGTSGIDGQDWSGVHRVKLLSITLNGKALI
jgi:hypothetical protein